MQEERIKNEGLAYLFVASFDIRKGRVLGHAQKKIMVFTIKHPCYLLSFAH